MGHLTFEKSNLYPGCIFIKLDGYNVNNGASCHFPMAEVAAMISRIPGLTEAISAAISVPQNLGAIIEGRDGEKYFRVDDDDVPWHSIRTTEWMSDDEMMGILRSGGRVIHEGMQSA